VSIGNIALVSAIIIAVGIIVYVMAGDQMRKLFTFLNQHDFSLALAVGILTGLGTTLIINRLQREAWSTDIHSVGKQLERLEERISETSRQLAGMTDRYDAHFHDVAKAISGPFTRSLFAYPALTSERIAEIVSEQSDELYQYHHERVLVESGKDTYLIEGLRTYGDAIIWSLRLHVTWTWYNDSKVPKRPLDDLVFVVASNDEAFSSFAGAAGSASVDQHKVLRSQFYGTHKNIVKVIAANPLNVGQHLDKGEVKMVFDIDRIVLAFDARTTVIEGTELEEINADEIHGIYSARRLPPHHVMNATLPPGETMRIDYTGHLYRLAGFYNEEYTGWIEFSPSDIVANNYDLVLLYPEWINFENQRYHLSVNGDDSGCSYIHDALGYHPKLDKVARREDIPAEFASFIGSSAKITAPHPLTSLHKFTLVWNGTPQGPAVEPPHDRALMQVR
jgi:hypothetical protein